MNRNTGQVHILPGDAVGAITQADHGKLAPVEIGAEQASAFVALDCFDRPLRASGRALIAFDGALQLFLPDGRVLRQPCAEPAPMVSDLGDGPVAQALSDISPLRRLLPVGKGTLTRRSLAFVDDEEKTQARLHLACLTAKDGPTVSVASVAPLRGYDKAGEALGDTLKALEPGSNAGALYDRLFPDARVYVAKPQIVETRDEPAFDIASDIIAAYIEVARQNEAGVVADHDTEFLHD